jgi:hypothetical protein
MWVFWQWRGARLRQLAPSWAFDPEPTPDSGVEGVDPDIAA